MEFTYLKRLTVDVKTLSVKAHVRYWEDGVFYNMQDNSNEPCRIGDLWCPEIDLETGMIANWTIGVEASIHFKVCDQCSVWLKDTQGNVVAEIIDDYVPKMLCPKENGFGDYIIMDIKADGKIKGFKADLSCFSS